MKKFFVFTTLLLLSCKSIEANWSDLRYAGILQQVRVHHETLKSQSGSQSGWENPATVGIDESRTDDGPAETPTPKAKVERRLVVSKTEVSALQTMLKASGFDPGPIDGRMGPRTRRAKRAFDAFRATRVAATATKTNLSLNTAVVVTKRENVPPLNGLSSLSEKVRRLRSRIVDASPICEVASKTEALHVRRVEAIEFNTTALRSYVQAVRSIGMKTSGALGCADGVSRILKEAGFKIPHARSTIALLVAMRESGQFTEVPLNDARKGDVVISPTVVEREGRRGHTGFVLADGGEIILSNNSRRRCMHVNKGPMETLNRWQEFQKRRGNRTLLYRPTPDNPSIVDTRQVLATAFTQGDSSP